MKKLVIIFVMIAISSTYSQFIKSYGLKVGGTISHQEWSVILPGDFTKDDKLGINVGVFAEFISMPIFSLMTEMNYVQKGFESKYLNIDNGFVSFPTWKLRIDYLNISLLAKSKIVLGIVSPYLFVGPRIDLELGRTSSIPNNVNYDFEKSMVGLKLGIGSELEIFQIKFLTEFIYDYGFGDLNKRENIEVKSNSIDFRLGIFL